MIFTYKPVSKRRFTRIEDIPEGVPLRVLDWYENGTPCIKVFRHLWQYPMRYIDEYTAFQFSDPDDAEILVLSSDTFILELW